MPNILNHYDQTHQGKTPLPFRPKTKRDKIALEIAKEFHDEKHLPTYLLLCKKYDEEIITKAYADTKAVPYEKIKKSRPALFIFLLRKYANKKKD